MYFYLYKITNLINNKIYVGVHKTKDINDGYMGSGKIINNAIKKYGLENFKKEIIEYFNSSEEMFKREKEVITEDFLSRNDVYNLRRGGNGGFDYINKDKNLIRERNKKVANKRDFTNQRNSIRKVKETKEYREKLSIALKEYYKSNPGKFKGKSHTQETKNKMSASIKGKTVGEKNSQFGTMWITDGIKNKKILKTSPIPKGWYKGRKII
jgi:hypothetical protein